jgi:uncharacterized protein
MKGNGIYFLNLPERGSQSWEDIRSTGCISTAGCPRAEDAISEFVPGDTIAAYLRGRGYVGVGVVLTGAMRDANRDGYRLPVRWLRAVDRSDARWSPRSGLYASPQVRAAIGNQPITLNFLQTAFGMPMAAQG